MPKERKSSRAKFKHQIVIGLDDQAIEELTKLSNRYCRLAGSTATYVSPSTLVRIAVSNLAQQPGCRFSESFPQ